MSHVTNRMLQPIIGLEIHIELKTASKMFCRCKNSMDLNVKPNSLICPVCTGMPGSLPAINQDAVEMVIKTGLALNCQVAKETKWDRKNYFYPDLPKGYQISQYDLPLTNNGFLEIEGEKIGIRRVHLEEDTGKLVHPVGSASSLVDLNRAGVPLMELVTEPDITSARIGAEFAKELQLILRYLDVSDADMEKGQMRVEVNISLRAISNNRPGGASNKVIKYSNTSESEQSEGERLMLYYSNTCLGTKVEVKNLNSFRSVEKAIDYEIKRQSKLLDQGEKIVQETRGWDEKAQKTVVQRTKEEAADYRYFPEPDLPFLEIETLPFSLEELKESIEELPLAKKNRLMENYGFSTTEAEILIREPVKANFLEEVIVQFEPQNREGLVKTAINWLVNRLPGEIISPKEKFLFQRISEGEEKPINAKIFAEFVKLIFEGKISSTLAQKILEEMKKTGKNPLLIIKESKIEMIADEKQLEEIIKKIIEQNKKVVADFKKGKENALQFLVGLAMRETRGKADPQKVSKILKKFLQAL